MPAEGENAERRKERSRQGPYMYLGVRFRSFPKGTRNGKERGGRRRRGEEGPDPSAIVPFLMPAPTGPGEKREEKDKKKKRTQVEATLPPRFA